MNRRQEIELEKSVMRWLHGEMPADQAAALRARVESDPAAGEVYRRLAAAWDGLAMPPAAPVPLGFEGRVMARVRAAGRGAEGLSWSMAPGWVRGMAAAALAVGVALGAGIGLDSGAPIGPAVAPPTSEPVGAPAAPAPPAPPDRSVSPPRPVPPVSPAPVAAERPAVAAPAPEALAEGETTALGIDPDGLAESYWAALEDDGGSAALDDEGGPDSPEEAEAGSEGAP